MLPQVNATLFSVIESESVQTEDWDLGSNPTGGTPRWIGSEDAYVQEKTKTSFATNTGDLVRTKLVTMFVSSTVTAPDESPVLVEEGDIITYEYRGETQSRVAMNVTAPSLPGADIAEYTRIDMNPSPLETALSTE